MKKKKIVVIFIVVCLILAVLLGREKSKQSNGNIANMGLAIEYEGTIYYNKYEKGIFSKKGGKEKQITYETAYSINIEDNKIYYLTVENFNDVVIKCVDTNGKNLTNLATIYTSISKIFVEDGYIYFATNKSGGGIARIDINGKNETVVIGEKIKDFHVSGGKIFYINEQNKMSKASVTGQENEVMAEEVMVQKIQVIDNWVYYYDETENALFRIDSNSKKKELISVLVNNDIYNVSGDYVYYLDTENSKISRMQIGKSNKCQEIVDISITKTKINIAKDELYYLDKSAHESQTYQMYRIKINGELLEQIKY